MKNYSRLFVSLLIMLSFISISSLAINANSSLNLKDGNFQIVVSGHEVEPVKLAVATLSKDFEKVMHYKPEISQRADNAKGIDIVVVNESTDDLLIDKLLLRSLDGFESHRIYCDVLKRRIYIHGKDMRGTIYALYTFSEQFLEVPALWYFSSWEPQYKKQVMISSDFDYYQKSPQVRYRAWFPNDTDLFEPWRKLSKENDELWLETMLRLKLNTVELEATVTYPDYKLNSRAALLRKYGLILTSHHHVACNNNLMNWEGYWRTVRKMEPPKLLLSDEESLREFWQYSIETVCRDKQENLWQISFRGINDQPFWAAFSDAPETDKERAEVINRMIRIQLDMIKEATGEKDPFVRMTFYDELSDLLAKDYLQPPTGENMLWTFVAGRRDHYPYDDLVAFDTKKQVKLGYYMNLQFTSTGAHLAPAEGPWKMEFNYRYVNTRGPLTFSVVNAGNLREFVMEMAANACMMWDMQLYDTDSFLLDFCTQYFGKKHAAKVAKLYHDYYYAYWQQKPSAFPNMERQFIFQDLRYSRVFDQIGKRFQDFSPNPLYDIGFERIPGRTFRIDGNNQVDSLIAGMERAVFRFGEVSRRCEDLLKQLPCQDQRFFRDNLAAPCHYMEALSRSLYHFVLAYKNTDERVENLDAAIRQLEEARDTLYATQEGVFATWYTGDSFNGKFNIPAKLKLLYKLRKEI
ncbi:MULTISPECIES: glycosyl hydrolase 115 family protein [Bacteroides]|uniref:glycosyl hydrolase 115 family protein n=1 Tax=Bacteroides TaxID=816 RepID=UPI0018A0B942|nr:MULTISPECIES: glycosyl hydrolase 115 family protein [Bacteroides]MDC2611982.1 glycosyl hydrolase 115 family protein [Bacteroides ovatus]MDC2632880.1 glycosyl hydrolase 115 family protein [Bacteroides ovatus]